MPHQHAPQRQSLLVHLQLADLGVHRGDHSASGLGVVAGAEVAATMLGIPQFEIRHVNIDHPVHEPDAIHAVVGRSIIDQRQVQAALDCQHQSLENLRHDVFGGDEVDVMATERLQLEHHARKVLGPIFCAFAQLARLEVLAEHAP